MEKSKKTTSKQYREKYAKLLSDVKNIKPEIIECAKGMIKKYPDVHHFTDNMGKEFTVKEFVRYHKFNVTTAISILKTIEDAIEVKGYKQGEFNF